MEKIRLVTGMRPTGKLHIGHYAGAMKNMLALQESGKYDSFMFIADMQAFTDNAENSSKIRNSVDELMLDYLACGIDPNKTTLFIQSQIPELNELSMIYMNIVTLARLERNPTVKTEISQKEFGKSIPVGFLVYPISQAADITAFDAKVIPCGEDQMAIIEQEREIVRSFNRIYGDTLVEAQGLISKSENAKRLVGTDGNAKMGKSLDNCIYLSDDDETIRKAVMSMYTDPNHLRVEDPGDTKNNPVFMYLDVFAENKEEVLEMKKQYEMGGLGDVKVKKYLVKVMQDFIRPIRERRNELAKNMDAVKKIFKDGSIKARKVASATLKRVRRAIGIDYFD
ncbi:MAG: tryptophan--tRNA ligase [Clostridia bacterium]